jgi:hypothetical protein
MAPSIVQDSNIYPKLSWLEGVGLREWSAYSEYDVASK